MNVVQLPNDIIQNIFEFIPNIIQISYVNKEFYILAKPTLENEKKRTLDKKIFLVDKCGRGTDIHWLHKAFHSVTTLEECEFVREVYEPLYGFEFMKRQARYIIGNTFQLAAETWTAFLIKYPINKNTRL